MDLAWSLVGTPTLLFWPLTWGALNDPSVILDDWDVFLPCFGLPYAAALLIWLHVRRTKGSA